MYLKVNSVDEANKKIKESGHSNVFIEKIFQKDSSSRFDLKEQKSDGSSKVVFGSPDFSITAEYAAFKYGIQSLMK
jgi:hypothetical protein